MFESVIAAMLKHKQVVFATIAVVALVGGITAPAQFASAALGDDIAGRVLDNLGLGDGGGGANDNNDNDDDNEDNDDNQNIDQRNDQSNTQENDQDQTARNDVDQSNDQSESNTQANRLDTGDNTATVAQSNREDQDVSADADADDNVQKSAAEADAEDNDHFKVKGKKVHISDSDETSAEADATNIIRATAEATGIQGDQSNTADVDQDSSIHHVDLSNNVRFGDDTNTQVAVTPIDQDQRSEQNAANLAANLAANIDVDYGFRTVEGPQGPPGPPGEPGEDNGPPFGQGGGRGPD
jgi:hypothetical protein